MYRAVTLAVLRAGLEPAPSPDAEEVAGRRGRPCARSPTRRRRSILLDGEDVEAEIRGAEVTRAVSAVSAHARGACRAGANASAS